MKPPGLHFFIGLLHSTASPLLSHFFAVILSGVPAESKNRGFAR